MIVSAFASLLLEPCVLALQPCELVCFRAPGLLTPSFLRLERLIPLTLPLAICDRCRPSRRRIAATEPQCPEVRTVSTSCRMRSLYSVVSVRCATGRSGGEASSGGAFFFDISNIVTFLQFAPYFFLKGGKLSQPRWHLGARARTQCTISGPRPARLDHRPESGRSGPGRIIAVELRARSARLRRSRRLLASVTTTWSRRPSSFDPERRQSSTST